MTDKDRMDVVDDCYKEMKRLMNLTAYYTNKNISVSYLRAKKKADTKRVVALYGDGSEKYWGCLCCALLIFQTSTPFCARFMTR